jgi:hypothetical protein
VRFPATSMVLLLLPSVLCAQSGRATAEPPRAWIRHTTTHNSLDRGIKGSVMRIAADTIFVRPRGRREDVAVLMTERTRFQLPQGTTRGTGRGTRLGAGIGAGAGLLMVLVGGGGASVGPGGPSGGNGAVILIPALVGVVGAGVGAILGSASTVEAWSPPMSLMGVMPTLSGVPGAR